MGSKLTVYCLKYAESALSESQVFLGGREDKAIPISFAIYLIKTKGKNILLDAGCTTMPGFEMQNFQSPAEVLAQMGISADEITDIVITHAHHDHIQAVACFPNAVIHIAKAEYEDGSRYIPENRRVITYEDAFCVADGVEILPAGGHNPGSLIGKIQADGIIHIFAGDECYTNANIEKRICTGSLCDIHKARTFVEKYSNPKYRVHTCHDISLKTERIIGYESNTD